MNLKVLLTGLGVGAGLMYFLDPRHGNRRRALVRDKVNSTVNRIDDSIEVTGKMCATGSAARLQS